MTHLAQEVRQGQYFDSVVLMQLQTALRELPGVTDCGVVMATAANRDLLRANGLLAEGETLDAGAEDLLIVVQGRDEAAAREALAAIDELLVRRGGSSEGSGYRPHGLEAAVRALPEARWVLVSVPGRYASRLAREALDLGRNVFLYSDNVPLDDEYQLKRLARERGLLVMGPDCGTAVVAGAGLGFANRVRRGSVGLVGASGTGLQAILCRIHSLGQGVSHALGTGGRDLGSAIGGQTAGLALETLARDPATEVIVLVSKPPAPEVAARLLTAARICGKPVVVCFLGYPPPARRLGSVWFAGDLLDAAEIAAELVAGLAGSAEAPEESLDLPPSDGVVRGLFCGGTLAQQAALGLGPFLRPLGSNVGVPGVEALDDLHDVSGHVVIDLGDDAFTVGRLHPMIDPEILWRRMRSEAEDPAVGTLLLDVVLGDGAHADPASGLAPVVREIRDQRPDLEVVAVVVGSPEDPQDPAVQAERLREAGARVLPGFGPALDAILGRHVRAAADTSPGPGVDPAALAEPFSAINVGLESFYDSLGEQELDALQVDWRPPAGGDRRLLEILDRLRVPAASASGNETEE